MALHYVSLISEIFYNNLNIRDNSSYGWYLYVLHSVGATVVLVHIYFHILKTIYLGSHIYNVNLWLSGLCILYIVWIVAFQGYILLQGMISYWGCIVINSLLSVIPNLVVYIIGNLNI